jgi:hypothetical protein
MRGLAPCACGRGRHHSAPPQIREGSWEAVGSEHREVGGGGELWGRRDRSAVRLEAAGSEPREVGGCREFYWRRGWR